MKIALTVCTALIILSVSCKKSNDQINTPPVVTDTIKPPVIKVDTSTLLKSSWVYSYDATGTAITDSAYQEWIYDDQRRIIQNTTNSSNHIDSFSYTFLSDRYLVSWHSYNDRSLSVISNAIYYQHVKNRTDSILTIGKSYGVIAGQDANYFTYFYYNQANQDSLEKNTQIGVNGGGTYHTSINYYYTGASLDSTVSLGIDGKLSDVSYFLNGNRTVEKWYFSGTQAGIEQFTYSSIATGGLNVVFRNDKLQSGYTSVTIPATTTYTGTYTYQMDSANRVKVMLTNINGNVTLKQVFTYY